MRGPDFLIIGAAKSATTWLQTSLQANRGVFMPDPELHFFSRAYETGLDSYLTNFAAAPKGALCGEKSNSYLSDCHAAQRIHHDLPETRLVAQLRDPVQRAYSDYCMLYRRGEVGGDIHAYLDPRVAQTQRFIRDGLYFRQLQPFIDLFGREAILILFTEDIPRDPAGQIARLAEHIGLNDPLVLPKGDRVKDSVTPVVPPRLRRFLQPFRPLLDPLRNTAPMRAIRGTVARKLDYPPLPSNLLQPLIDYYEEDTRKLEKLIGRNLTMWKSIANRKPSNNGPKF